MRIAILSCVLTIPVTLLAQDAPDPQKRWSVGVSGSLDVCFRQLVINSDDPYMDLLVDLRDDMEEPRTGFTAGVDITYDLSQHWVLATGLQYNDRGFADKETPLIFTDVNGSTLSEGSMSAKVHYTFMSVPLLIRYRAGHGKVRFEPALGVSADLYQAQYTDLELNWADGRTEERRTHDEYSDFPTWGVSGWVELCASMPIGERFVLRAGGRGRYQLNELLDAPLSAHLFEAGFMAGAALRF